MGIWWYDAIAQCGRRGPAKFAQHEDPACRVMVDRVIHPDPGHVEWEALRAKLVGRFEGLRFPPADGETVLIQPLLFGGTVGKP